MGLAEQIINEKTGKLVPDIELSNNIQMNIGKLELRNIIVPESVNSRIPWLLETPKSIREDAVFEFVKNRKACFTNLSRGNIKHFKMNFLERKNPTWTLGGLNNVKRINNRRVCFFESFIGIIKTTENIPEIKHDCKVHFDGLNHYLIVPIDVPIKKIYNRKCQVSGDPGVRDFYNFYDTESLVEIAGANDVFKLLLNLDSFISKKSKANCSQKKVLDNRILKTRRRIKNLQHELHNKTATWLCNNYDRIVIPKFESTAMSSKKTRKISSKTVRQMSVLAHSTFLSQLINKAKEKSVDISIVNEAYTTKTCGVCFEQCHNIYSKKEWTCPTCKSNHLRDCNASRLIGLADLFDIQTIKQ